VDLRANIEGAGVPLLAAALIIIVQGIFFQKLCQVEKMATSIQDINKYWKDKNLINRLIQKMKGKMAQKNSIFKI
jgi:hypothetical protein